MTTLVRQLARYDVLDERVQTVVLKNGAVVSSVRYALSFVNRFYDVEYRQQEFGIGIDYQDLQSEMLEALVRAAHYYLKWSLFDKPFRPYLLQTLLAALDTLRRRNKVAEQYLDDFLDDDEIDYAIQRRARNVLADVDSTLTVMAFAQTLTARQRSIVEYWYKVDYHASDREVAEYVGCSQKTVWRDRQAIEWQLRLYAKHEPGWQWFLKRVDSYAQ